MQETNVRFLGQEEPLEKELAIHSSILAWEIPLTEESGGLQCMGLQESWTGFSNETDSFTWLLFKLPCPAPYTHRFAISQLPISYPLGEKMQTLSKC